jgi:hypothetical protein
MRIRYAITGVVALAVLGASVAVAAAASATTLTCTGIKSQTVPPFGCGGAQSAYQAKGVLDLAVLGQGSTSGNYWNSPVGVLADSESATREDFTVFAVNGSITDGPGGLGEFVAMYTPDGNIPTFTQGGVTHTNAVPQPGNFTVGTNVYCLSVENLDNGPHGALRWHVVLRTCATNGTFDYGNNGNNLTPPVAATENSVSASSANKFQVWAPVSGPSGLLLIDESLSHGFKSGNTPYVLDDSGFGGSGTGALAFPENDGLNQQWTIIGCSDPVSQLDTGYQFCP